MVVAVHAVLLLLLLSPCQRGNARAVNASIINNNNVMMTQTVQIVVERRESAYHHHMLQFGRHYYQPHHRWDKKKEEEWRRLLRDTMCDLNRRAFKADCKDGSRTPDQPPRDYYAFDPDDMTLVFKHVPAVHRCLVDIRQKARSAKRALPLIEALPPAIRRCTLQFLVEYLEDWERWRV